MQFISAALVLCCLIAVASYGQVSAFYGAKSKFHETNSTRPIDAIKTFWYPNEWNLVKFSTFFGELKSMTAKIEPKRHEKLFLGLGMIVDRSSVANQTILLMDRRIWSRTVNVKNNWFSPVPRSPAGENISISQLPPDMYGTHDYRLVGRSSEEVFGTLLRTYGLLLDFHPAELPDGDAIPLARNPHDYGTNCYLYGYGLDETKHSERSLEHFYSHDERTFVKVQLSDPKAGYCERERWPYRCALYPKELDNLICREAAAGAPVMCGNPPELTYIAEFDENVNKICYMSFHAWRIAPVAKYMRLPNFRP